MPYPYKVSPFAHFDQNVDKQSELLNAVYYGKAIVVEYLLKAGYDTNVKDQEGNTLLDIATQKGHTKIVELLTKNKTNVDNKDKNNQTQLSSNQSKAIFLSPKTVELVAAIVEGDFEYIKEAIELGVNINTKNRGGSTLLFLAAYNGHEEIVNFLITSGADVNIEDRCGYTVLHIVANTGLVEVTKLLIDGGADVNAINQNSGCTPLILAVQEGHLAIMKLLIESGADVDIRGRESNTILHFTVYNGHKEAVEYLIEIGCDIDAKNKEGYTALDIAIQKSHIEIVELLTKNKIYVDSKDEDDYISLNSCQSETISLPEVTIELFSAAVDGDFEYVEYAVELGIDVNTQNKYGSTPLFLAAYNGHAEIVEFLIKSGAKVNATNQSGDTPLILAVQEGHLEVVKLLIKNGADIHIRDQEGNTILHLAVYNGHEEIVKFLIERKFDINVKKQNGYTALHTAAQIGDVEMIKLLIENGADINITNNDGCKPIHIAALSGQKKALEFLKSKNTGIGSSNDNNKLFHIIKYDDVLENPIKGYDELFEQSNGNTLNYITPSHIFKIPFLVEIFKENTKLTDLSKGICVLFANFISFLNFNKKENFDELYDLINSNYRELNEENLKKFLEGKLEDRKTKEIFEFIQAIVKYFPLLNTGNVVYCDNCDNLLPQELLARDISDNEYDMQFYRTVINKSAILRILKNLEREDNILCIIAKITKDEIDHAISITKTCESRYILFDINKPNVLELSSEEEVCDIIELASNRYYEGLNCFPGIEFINSTKTVKKIIEHYAFKHKMYESENRPNYISSIDSTKKPKSQNKVSKNLTVLFMSLCAVSALALIVMCSVGHIDKLPKTFVGAVAGALFTMGVISMILWLQPSNKLDKAMLSHNQKKCL